MTIQPAVKYTAYCLDEMDSVINETGVSTTFAKHTGHESFDPHLIGNTVNHKN